MKEFKHTPGPWRTTPNGVVTSDSCQIAHVGETSRPADMVGSFERWDADARLIAAAPELLEALDNLLSWAEDIHTPGKTTRINYHGMDMARAAIAKALGESK